MSINIWIGIGIFYIVGMIYLGWEIYTSPIMPDDYGVKDVDKWKGNKRKTNKNNRKK